MPELRFLESTIKMPLMNLPVRSTIVPLKNGNVLISPGSFLSAEQLKKHPNITDIVAPSLFHCGGVTNAAKALPVAKTWGPIDARTRKSEINWQDELSVEKWPYQDELKLIQLKGMPKVNEAIFLHKKSKSLIVSDLCFNLTDARGFGSWLILSLFGTYKKFGVSRFFVKQVENKNDFADSLNELFKHDFDSIIVSHGKNVMRGGHNLLAQSLRERGFNLK